MPSGTCEWPKRGTARARRAPPSSRSTRCSCGRWPRPFGGSPAALLVAAYAVALGAFLGALTLLHRLVSLELGRPLAHPTLLLLAVFPAALYFGAPYAESLFLLLSVGAFYAARTGRWAWAGACAAAAAATRNSGVLLMLPLALIWWSSRERRPRDGAWILLRPARAGGLRALPGRGRGRRPALRPRARGLVPGAEGAARGRLGRARARRSTACARSPRTSARSSTSTRPAATRSELRPST